MQKTVQKEFVKYVSLNIMGMIGLSCYILADTYFVSARLGADGLTALNLAIAVYSLIHGAGLMIGIGGATRYAICKAEQDKERGSQAFTGAVILGLALGITLAVAGFFWAEPIAGILGAKGNILGLTGTYLKTIMCFSPFFILNNVLIAFIRNDNDPRLSMCAMLGGSLSNIILDYVFMYPLNMGIFGAAFATGLAPVISISILSIHFIRKKQGFALVKLQSLWRHITDIGSLGLSAFINEMSSAVVLITFNLLILSLAGNTGVAAYGIVANLALVVQSVFTGIGQGSQPLISRYYGVGEYAAARKIFKWSAFTAMAISVVTICTAYVFTDGLVSIFNSGDNRQLAEIAYTGLRLYVLGFLIAGVNIVTASYFSAVEKPKQSFVIAITRGCIGILFFGILLSTLFGMNGIWVAFSAAEGITVLFSLLFISKQTLAKQNFSK